MSDNNSRIFRGDNTIHVLAVVDAESGDELVTVIWDNEIPLPEEGDLFDMVEYYIESEEGGEFSNLFDGEHRVSDRKTTYQIIHSDAESTKIENLGELTANHFDINTEAMLALTTLEIEGV